MNKLDILIQGYAHPLENNQYAASPTTSLIYSNGKKVLVDPGANPDLLKKALTDRNLKPEDIDIVYISHYHPDHFLNIRIFPNHDIYDGQLIWSKDKEIPYSEKIPGTEIFLLATPGHSAEDTSLLIKTDDKGTICIAPDVFWWEDGAQKSDTVEDLMNLVDPFVADVNAFAESRKKVLEISDWIVPGHGKMFKNPKKV